MEQVTVYNELCKSFAKLKDLRDTNKAIVNSSARKYCYNYWVYVAEKMHTIECANLKPHSYCLDISTGPGLLPYILNNMGHTCDATDIGDPKDDLDYDVITDKDNEQQNAFVVMRQVHNVELAKNLSIDPEKYINFDKKYDCIFSTRIVWDSGLDSQAYKSIINNFLDYADKVVMSWNMDGIHDVPQVLQPYVSQSQFEYGTLTIHTEKIK